MLYSKEHVLGFRHLHIDFNALPQLVIVLLHLKIHVACLQSHNKVNCQIRTGWLYWNRGGGGSKVVED